MRGLVVAKAPVPGEVKTRLARDVGDEAAASLAAAALLDTLAAVEGAFPPGDRHLALAGDLRAAVRGEEIAARLSTWTVHPQRGAGLGERLAHAHADAGGTSYAVVQVGMDTPQVRPEVLRDLADRVAPNDRADRADNRAGDRDPDGAAAEDGVLGLAEDGGWWVLALRDTTHAEVLADVPMSTPRTGEQTAAALTARGLRLGSTVVLRDLDTLADGDAVAAAAPGSAFAEAWRGRGG